MPSPRKSARSGSRTTSRARKADASTSPQTDRAADGVTDAPTGVTSASPTGSTGGDGTPTPDSVQKVREREGAKHKGPEGGVGVQAAPQPLVEGRRMPNVVEDSNRRSINDVLMGHFATVTDGEHKGRLVVTEHPTEFDKNGWPVKVQVITRDAANERLIVDYDALAPARANRL